MSHGGSGDSGSHVGSGNSVDHGGWQSTDTWGRSGRAHSWGRLGTGGHSLGAGTGGCCLGVGTGGRCLGAGTGGRSGSAHSWGHSDTLERSLEAGTGGRCLGAGTGGCSGSAHSWGCSSSVASWGCSGNTHSWGGRSVSSWNGSALEWTLCWPLTAVGWIFPQTVGGRRAADDGGLILTWGRIFSRHRRIPSLHLSPMVSGRSTGRWELAPCQNSVRMVASSRAVAAASLQNSQEYSTNGRSWLSRAMKQAATGKKNRN